MHILCEESNGNAPKSCCFLVNVYRESSRMKLPKSSDRISRKSIKRTRHQRSTEPDHVTEMLKLCLQKICELQADLDNEAEVHDPVAAGYTACAMETLRFLSSQGLSSDHPMVKSITEMLLRNKE